MKRILAFLPIILLLMPSSAFAFLDWESSSGDKSIEYLGYLFGPVGTVLIPTQATSQILGAIFNIFNIVLLSMGSIAMVYVIWISAIETAHEGEVLGKRWSAAWIPIRTFLGVGLLLPTASGYSFSQIIMMWVVLHGVHAANAIWTVVLENYETSTVFSLPTDSSLGEVKGASDAAHGIFESLICMEMIKQKYPDAKSSLGGEVERYDSNGLVAFGVQGDEHHSKVCGSVQPSKAASGYDDEVWKNQQVVAGDNAAGALSPYAAEAVGGASVSGSEIMTSGRNIISAVVASTPKTTAAPVSLDTTKQNAKKDGWLFAGSYYHQFTTWQVDFKSSNLTSPQSIPPDYAELPFSESELRAYADAYLKTSDLQDASDETPTKLDLSPAGQTFSDVLLTFWNDTGLSDFFMGMATDFIDAMNAQDDDPIVSMQNLGSNLMVTVEGLFYTIVIAGFLAATLGCILECVLPICWAITAAISILVPLLTIFIVLLWSAGVLLGLYVPMIPYLVFTFTAFTWFLYVIEAMVAAPVAAMSLTNPSAENFGNVGPVMTLTLNIFMRPALMVIGFIAAERILKAIMYMINFGYSATLEASITGIGFFGAVVLVVLYVGIAVITVQECFSLVHILPDKVIRWIAGKVENSGVGQKLEESHGYLNKGADVGGDIMKGGLAAVNKDTDKGDDDDSHDQKDNKKDDGPGSDDQSGSEAGIQQGNSTSGAPSVEVGGTDGPKPPPGGGGGGGIGGAPAGGGGGEVASLATKAL